MKVAVIGVGRMGRRHVQVVQELGLSLVGICDQSPDDFIIATGEKHTVQEFINIVFQELGLDWKDYVEERQDILTRQMPNLIGNAGKLREQTGWSPSVTFHEMVRNLVHEALEKHEANG